MGLKVLQRDIMICCPGNSRPSKSMKPKMGRVKLERQEKPGEGGTVHRGRDRRQGGRGHKQGGRGGTRDGR